MDKIIKTKWQAQHQLLSTRLSGLLNDADIENWKHTLEQAVQQIPVSSSFKMLVDLYGFKAENFEVHKKFRTVMPLFLARFGYRIGYLGLFPEASLDLANERGFRCIAMVNVHQDETKMKDYQEKFSNGHEQYFTDSALAYNWIISV